MYTSKQKTTTGPNHHHGNIQSETPFFSHQEEGGFFGTDVSFLQKKEPSPFFKPSSPTPGHIESLQRKCDDCQSEKIIEGPANLGIQLKSDPTKPGELKEESNEITEEGTPQVNVGEGSDEGQAVASIEDGGPFGVVNEKEDERQQIQKRSENKTHQGNKLASPNEIQSSLGKGQRMDKSTTNQMESFFNVGFSDVNIHNDSRANSLADSLGAQAFTVGNDIAFASGKYNPGSNEGQQLLSHELTHVVQQRQGLSGKILKDGIGSPNDKYEKEAEAVAAQLDNNQPKANFKGSFSTIVDPPVANKRISRKPVLQLYNSGAAVSYARKWAKGTNSAYGRQSNDCTNFISQAMRAGGWSMIVGSSYCDDRKKNSVWWFRRSGCRYDACPWSWCPTLKSIHASYTWGGAENFYQFVRSSGRGSAASYVRDLRLGDVLQADWNGSGTINHTMIVTKKTGSNLYLSFHTNDRLDEPFWRDGRNPGILGRNPKADYYAWKIT